jgi:hypothetical protein
MALIGPLGGLLLSPGIPPVAITPPPSPSQGQDRQHGSAVDRVYLHHMYGNDHVVQLFDLWAQRPSRDGLRTYADASHLSEVAPILLDNVRAYYRSPTSPRCVHDRLRLPAAPAVATRCAGPGAERLGPRRVVQRPGAPLTLARPAGGALALGGRAGRVDRIEGKFAPPRNRRPPRVDGEAWPPTSARGSRRACRGSKDGHRNPWPSS